MTDHKEPQFVVADRKMIKDLVFYSQDRVVLVAKTKVISEQFILETAHENKVNKYLVLGDHDHRSQKCS